MSFLITVIHGIELLSTGAGALAVIALTALGGLLLLARARNKIEEVIGDSKGEIPELI